MLVRTGHPLQSIILDVLLADSKLQVEYVSRKQTDVYPMKSMYPVDLKQSLAPPVRMIHRDNHVSISHQGVWEMLDLLLLHRLRPLTSPSIARPLHFTLVLPLSHQDSVFALLHRARTATTRRLQ